MANDEEQYSLRPTFANAHSTKHLSYEKTSTKTPLRSSRERLALGLTDE